MGFQDAGARVAETLVVLQRDPTLVDPTRRMEAMFQAFGLDAAEAITFTAHTMMLADAHGQARPDEREGAWESALVTMLLTGFILGREGTRGR